ncbi:MAG TPA: hypothetical protein VHY22_11115 [Chthoniobacteraceae bacterium]|jgi:hypothetical protein|nr:hypothetical protein [Chthoniobacteraceae bacterium]
MLKRIYLAAFLLTPLVPLRANLVTNGNFESGPVTTGYSALTGGDAGDTGSFTGWTAVAGNGNGPNVYYNTATNGASWIPTPIAGTNDVQLDSTDDGNAYTQGSKIYTTNGITLNPGGYYSLTFSIATEVGAGKGGTSYADVTLFTTHNGTYNSTVRTSIIDGTYSTVNGAEGSTSTTSWTTYTINFQYLPANGSSNNVAFLQFQDDVNSGNSNISIDNVSLEVVPEYTHWAMFGLFGAACVVVELRRRKIAA